MGDEQREHGVPGTFDATEWEIVYHPVPQQNNEVDDGVFATLFYLYQAAGMPLDFTQEDIAPMRKFFAQLIYNIGEASRVEERLEARARGSESFPSLCFSVQGRGHFHRRGSVAGRGWAGEGGGGRGVP